MDIEPQRAIRSAAELAGDLAPLLEQLGLPAGVVGPQAVPALLNCPRVEDLPSLRRFLETYRAQVLLALELPAIRRAFEHACRFEVCELLAFDRELGREPLLAPFALASLHVGREQLRRLRPLRDQRLVQRYLQAVEAGEASGWHTLVYGVTLSLYSLPLRQGLLGYARQTLGGFTNAAARSLHLPETEIQGLLDCLCDDLPAALKPILANAGQIGFPTA